MTAFEKLYIQFSTASEGHSNIRRWSQFPFAGGEEYALTAALQSAADTPPDIDQVATRIASKYLTLDISCERLYRDVVEALTAERAVASRKSAADTPAPPPPETHVLVSDLTKRLRSMRSCTVCEGDGIKSNGKQCGGCGGVGDVHRYDRTGVEATIEIDRAHAALLALMAKLADLLDEDHFADCEEIVRKVGIAPPPQPNLRVIADACEGIDDDYMTSETHHPGWVLIPQTKFDAIRAALAATATEDGISPSKVEDE